MPHSSQPSDTMATTTGIGISSAAADEQGYEAACNGGTFDDCPYDRDEDRLYEAWTDGFERARVHLEAGFES